MRIRKIGIWVEPFVSTEQGIWSEYQSPVRSSFTFLNVCGGFSLPLFQNGLQCPDEGPVPERFFNYSFMKYVKISVKADDSHICDLEKGRNTTALGRDTPSDGESQRLGFWQRRSMGLDQAGRCCSPAKIATRGWWARTAPRCIVWLNFSSFSNVNQV